MGRGLAGHRAGPAGSHPWPRHDAPTSCLPMPALLSKAVHRNVESDLSRLQRAGERQHRQRAAGGTLSGTDGGRDWAGSERSLTLEGCPAWPLPSRQVPGSTLPLPVHALGRWGNHAYPAWPVMDVTSRLSDSGACSSRMLPREAEREAVAPTKWSASRTMVTVPEGQAALVGERRDFLEGRGGSLESKQQDGRGGQAGPFPTETRGSP